MQKLILSLLLSFGLAALAADTVEYQLVNGDRITGILIVDDGDQVVVRTEFLGDVIIPKSAIFVPDETAAVEAATPGAVSAEEPALPGGWQEVLKEWALKFDAGYTFQSGRRDRTELSLRAEANRTLGRSGYRILAEYLLSKIDDQTGTDRIFSSFRWRRDVSEFFFTQTLTQYERDRVRLIDHRIEQNVSMGWRFLNQQSMRGSLGPGLSVRYNKEQGIADEVDMLVTLFQDFSWDIYDNLRIEQDFVTQIDPGNSDDYNFRFNAGLIGRITPQLNMSLRYQLLWENIVAPDVDKADHRVITTIGYQF
jgi:putative salt-induced outer membrane protein YdiY